MQSWFEVINNAQVPCHTEADARRAGGAIRNYVAMCMALLQVAQDVSSFKRCKTKENRKCGRSKIQKIFKGTQGRKIYQEKITELATTFRFANAAVLLQKMMRGYYARMVLFKGVLDDHKSRVRRNSATNIQKHLRGSLARWHFNHAKIEERKRIDAAIRLQSN